jgi:hypothetical protein
MGRRRNRTTERRSYEKMKEDTLSIKKVHTHTHTHTWVSELTSHTGRREWKAKHKEGWHTYIGAIGRGGNSDRKRCCELSTTKT